MMEPFDPERRCPKCGNQQPLVTFCAKDCASKQAYLLERGSKPTIQPATSFFIPSEHLHRDCQRCDYSWLELPLDAEAAPRNLLPVNIGAPSRCCDCHADRREPSENWLHTRFPGARPDPVCRACFVRRTGGTANAAV